MTITATRTRVRYFLEDDVKALSAELRKLESSLNRRAPFIPGEAYCDALDRIESVRLAVKRLMDVVPE